MADKTKPALFEQEFYAYNGYVLCKELFNATNGHTGQLTTDTIQADAIPLDRLGNTLTDAQKDVIDLVIMSYGRYGPDYLLDLVCREQPYLSAKIFLHPLCGTQVSKDNMREFYASLYQ